MGPHSNHVHARHESRSTGREKCPPSWQTRRRGTAPPVTGSWPPARSSNRRPGIAPAHIKPERGLDRSGTRRLCEGV